ncbi:Cubilin [Lamellibrachia satsuma]|nr:Cubilin [Lamellibrachia satsuma]
MKTSLPFTLLDDKACGGTLEGSSGTFTTPEHPNNYPDALNCTWYIVAEPGELIRLTFTSFNLESHASCYYDHVSVYDNFTTASRIGRYCGHIPPTVLTSSDNILMVKFVSDANIAKDGFSASYVTVNATTACGRDFTDPVGFIRSPNYPNEYPNNRVCVWRITMETGKQILLNVTDFAMEPHLPTCHNDYLEIRDGGFADSPLIGRYCEGKIDRVIRSHSNRLYLKMETDDTVTDRGFNIYYDATMSGCGGTMSNPTGSFISPNYPYPYPHSVECFWTITVALGNVIQLEFVDFKTETHSTCEYDYLQIREQDANGALRAQYCGEVTPLPLVSRTNQLYFKFRTDGSYSAAGFHASYVTRCTNHLKSYSGVIESPSFMKSYPGAQDCVWVVETTTGNALNVSFSHFSLEASDNCDYDYLELRDGMNATSPLIGKYCDSELPMPVTTNSSAIYVHFVSDDSVASYGFRLEYVTFGCGNVFRSPSGSFGSPAYPSPYPTPRECAWSISVPMGSMIVMTIDDLDLETHTTCDLESLEIYGGHADTSPLLTRLCHTQTTGQKVTSTGNHMFVRYRTDGMQSGRGFHASYKAISGGCGGNFTARTGVITSQNYPNNYPHNTDCGWLITVEQGRTVTLTFDDLDVEEDEHCTFDYVAVFDGSSTKAQQLGKLCGDTLPSNHVMTSMTNQMYIRMRSDNSVRSRGFKASYKTGCGGVVDVAREGAITSPGWPGPYEKDRRCVWRMQAAQPGT